MHARFLPFPRRQVAALLALGTLGCAGPLDPTTRPVLPAGDGSVSQVSVGAGTAAVGAAAQPGFYPLRAGNRWEHLFTTSYQLIPAIGDPPPPETYQYLVRRSIDPAPFELAGREYLQEQAGTTGGGPGSFTVLYRQDATGLYEFTAIRMGAQAGVRSGIPGSGEVGAFAGVDARAVERLLTGRGPAEREAFEAAARQMAPRIALLGTIVRGGQAATARLQLPGTAAPYETIRLRYPLEPRMTWTVLDFGDSRLTAEVVEAEVLDVARGSFLGHRIRLSGAFLGPNDSSEMWFGPSGYLQSVAHVEFDATDQTGNIVGRWLYDQREELLDVYLVGSQIVDLPPGYYRPRK